ncbi:MAG: YesL family protein [Lachnospiraceae bacterium]|nr:YesL family protein [Candidatus Equihabitans merdae]
MNRLFNQNTPFWKFMGRVYDAFVLNVMWLLCCIPIFTIGPATTAFYYAMLGMVRQDGGYISKDFIKSFKMNFKQGIQLGLPITLLGAFLALDIYLCYHAGRGIYSFFMFFFVVIFIVWFAVSLYVFVILAKFERKNKEILIWAFTFCIKNLPRTLLLMLEVIFGIWVIHLLPGLVLIMPGLVVESHCGIFSKIFEPYLPTTYDPESEGETPANEDFNTDDINDVNQWLL